MEHALARVYRHMGQYQFLRERRIHRTKLKEHQFEQRKFHMNLKLPPLLLPPGPVNGNFRTSARVRAALIQAPLGGGRNILTEER